MILDSGQRTEYSTGAVRDIQEGKGRCDLLPLGVISEYLQDRILIQIELYKISGNTDYLEKALSIIANDQFEDTISMLLEVSKHYEEGSEKYGENNWQKGIPLHSYIDSAARHYLKMLRGDNDERHDLAFVWNILNCIWTHINKPEMIDLPFRELSK